LGFFKFAYPAIKSTRFGIPYNYNKAPKAITGYFKYAAGTRLTKKDRSSTLTKDTWNAYAILFEKSDVDNYLLGDHNFADARIVSIAKLKDAIKDFQSEALFIEISHSKKYINNGKIIMEYDIIDRNEILNSISLEIIPFI